MSNYKLKSEDILIYENAVINSKFFLRLTEILYEYEYD